MNHRVFFVTEGSRALDHAAKELEMRGITVTRTPTGDTTHLLLPVPCTIAKDDLEEILQALPKDVIILGGFLDTMNLSGYECYDLLKDAQYLAQNAKITAYCAMSIVSSRLPVIWENCPVLITGWGRIGKCLGTLLQRVGAEVSIAARKPEDLAMISALGYHPEDIGSLSYILKRYRVIFNTVPFPVLSEEQLKHCRPDCLKIELASKPGIAGNDVILAKGLPGKYAPESSGKLIARTVLRLCARREAQQ